MMLLHSLLSIYVLKLLFIYFNWYTFYKYIVLTFSDREVYSFSTCENLLIHIIYELLCLYVMSILFTLLVQEVCLCVFCVFDHLIIHSLYPCGLLAFWKSNKIFFLYKPGKETIWLVYVQILSRIIVHFTQHHFFIQSDMYVT